MFLQTTALVILAAILVGGGLLLRWHRGWIYDRSQVNPRDWLPSEYDLPRYFRLDRAGKVNTACKWPGWDGWYFAVLPLLGTESSGMLRASVMTGLYGLNGVDSYAQLPSGITTFDAVEHFMQLVSETKPGPMRRDPLLVTLSHDYVHKTELQMKTECLDVEIESKDAGCCGVVRGQWPDYHVRFSSPIGKMVVDLGYHGENLIWWADVPAIFTYFASFGTFTGTLTYSDENGSNQSRSISTKGSFEHGFARKQFNYDVLYGPVRLCQKFAPRFKPIRYHYELLMGTNPTLQGGFMRARGFGIKFRNLGGVYIDGRYEKMVPIEVEYDPQDADHVSSLGPHRPPVIFYRRWRLRARTPSGELEYVARRHQPAKPVSSNMMYYTFSFQGTHAGSRIEGTGYGEYLHI